MWPKPQVPHWASPLVCLPSACTAMQGNAVRAVATMGRDPIAVAAGDSMSTLYGKAE